MRIFQKLIGICQPVSRFVTPVPNSPGILPADTSTATPTSFVRHCVVVILLLLVVSAGCASYGPDSRVEARAHPNESLRRMANSVAVLVNKDVVSVAGGAAQLQAPSFDKRVKDEIGIPLCPGELFATQPTPGSCTGFLVRPDILITAGHCVENEQVCSNTRFVFGFELDNGGNVLSIPDSNVFECKSLIHQNIGDDGDFAVIRLDRDTGRAGLPFASHDQVVRLEPIAAIGHPVGLPKKTTGNAAVIDAGSGSGSFLTNLDTFIGSSGSPVIDVDVYEVIGLIVGGEDDFEETTTGCITVKRCPTDATGCEGETATKMSTVATFVPR